MFSAVAVLIYQGGITLCAGILGGVLSTVVIGNMSAVGSLLIVVSWTKYARSFRKIKVANLLPAIFIPIIFGIF